MKRTARSGFAFWAAIGTALTTALSLGIAVMTPPLSGPFCREGCIGYPYLNVLTRFPRDYYWMFPAIVATLFFVALIVALQAGSTTVHRDIGTLSVALSVMAATLLVADYFVQLAVIQPSLLAGEVEGISLINQYNPHGIFIALEELGYLLMSLSLATMTAAMPTLTVLERVVRRVFAGGFVINVTALVTIAWRLGHARGYVFEVVVITVNWVVLIIGGLILAITVRRHTAAAITPVNS